MTIELDAKIPGGPLEQKWARHRFELKLVNPANKRKFKVIVVGSVWRRLSAARGEMATESVFCFRTARPRALDRRRGHQRPKNYQSGYRFPAVFDTIKGVDYRARGHVYRLPSIASPSSTVRGQGVPSPASTGLLANRSSAAPRCRAPSTARPTGQHSAGPQSLALQWVGHVPVPAHRDAGFGGRGRPALGPRWCATWYRAIARTPRHRWSGARRLTQRPSSVYHAKGPTPPPLSRAPRACAVRQPCYTQIIRLHSAAGEYKRS